MNQNLDPETQQRLIEAAKQARQNAYMPYSGYAVGAALLADDGTIYTGCNVENASFGATICAERTAVVKAVSEGARNFTAIAVVTDNGGSPCGMCRQVLFEFGSEIVVIMADAEGQNQHYYLVSDLLPRGFGPKTLNKANNTQDS